jgi:hypothetical protein
MWFATVLNLLVIIAVVTVVHFLIRRWHSPRDAFLRDHGKTLNDVKYSRRTSVLAWESGRTRIVLPEGGFFLPCGYDLDDSLYIVRGADCPVPRTRVPIIEHVELKNDSIKVKTGGFFGETVHLQELNSEDKDLIMKSLHVGTGPQTRSVVHGPSCPLGLDRGPWQDPALTDRLPYRFLEYTRAGPAWSPS